MSSKKVIKLIDLLQARLLCFFTLLIDSEMCKFKFQSKRNVEYNYMRVFVGEIESQAFKD